MATTDLKIGIVGRGPAALTLADRLRAIDGVSIVGSCDADLAGDQALADLNPSPSEAIPSFENHFEMLRQVSPDALVISTPRRSHYRSAMDGLQAGCHLLILTAPSMSVQESTDIVRLARARDLKVALGHTFRRIPSLIRARELLAQGAIGRPCLITSTLCRPWKAEPGMMRGGVLADFGLDWVDALLWTSGRPAQLVSAVQVPDGGESGLDAVSSASIRLGDGVLASLAISGVASEESFEMIFHGDAGRLRATGRSLVLQPGVDDPRIIPVGEAIVGPEVDFVAALRSGSPMGCPAEEALDAVRLLEAIARSAAIGQFVGLG